eukprot:gene7187-26758_t
MLTWLTLSIGGLHKVKGMPLVGLGCIATVLLSTAAGFGLCLGFGVKFNPIVPVLPIMLLGIGVDDAYVLIGAYKDTPRHLPVEDRIKLTLANGGVAITMTSLTDIAAFAAGTFAQVSAIQAFCLFAAVAIAVDYFLQITLFMHTAHTDEGDSDVFGTFLKEKWAPLVLHPVGKAVILVAFAGLFGMFAYFATLTTVAQSPKEITPPDSVLTVLDKLEESGAVATDWAGGGTQCWLREFVTVWLPLNTGGVGADCADTVEVGRTAAFSTCLLAFSAASEAAHAAVVDKSGIFPIFFSEDAKATIPWNIDFLYNPSTPSIDCSNTSCPAGGTLESSRCWARFPKTYTGLEKLEQARHMETMRNVVATESGDLAAFAISNEFFNLERFSGFLPTTRLNVGSAFVACVVVTWFFLISPVLVAVIALMVVSIDAWLFGLMTLWDVNLNESSVVCVVMACGFAVDFCAHVGHSFKYSTGTGNERATHAIGHAGRAIANAGFTTLLATTCLVAGGAIFITFSKMFFGIIVFGLLHALTLLPVILSFCTCCIASAPEEKGAFRVPSRKSLAFRRYFAAFVGLAGVGFVGVVFGMPWCSYSGTVVQYDYQTGCDTAELVFADYAEATGTELVQPVYTDLVKASKSTAVPVIAAGIAGLAAFLAFLAAGLYQNTLNDYINIEVSFSDTFTEEDANPSRDPGFVALFGSFACFVVVAANNLTLRAEEGAAQNANGGIKVHVTGV